MAVVSMVSLDGDRIIQLDATERVNYSRQNQSTQHSVMSGAKVSDTYQIGNPQISFSGICTYSKSVFQKDNPTPEELHILIDELIENFGRFELVGNKLIPSMDNCVILQHNVTQEGYLDAVHVSLTVEQQFISNQAKVTTIKVPSKKLGGEGASLSDQGSGTGTAVGEEKKKEIKQTLFKKGVISFEEFVGAANSVEE